MTQTVHKAVFPAAGFCTHFLPVTKAMPKELPPVVDKPLFQYVAKEAITRDLCITPVFMNIHNFTQ
jgi:UTP--glucose-1-phosphate uridylyltransferase